MAKIGRNDPCPCGSGRKFKKCCGSVVGEGAWLNQERTVRAYSDETGNSGNNLFDSGQPYFWTGTLVCDVDVEREGASLHAKCLELSSQSELHGNKLGLSGIEKIAPVVQDLFFKLKPHFLLTRIEKTHLAATKFFDVLMDSGINHAISNLQYAYRATRLPLAVQFIQLLDDLDRREFWGVYRSADAEGFKKILSRLRDRLRGWHERGLYHDRTVELLRDGIEWGMKYPEPLLESTMGELDSPNIVAFSLLVTLLHELHSKTGMRVGTFVHDEQNEFGKSLLLAFDLLRRFGFERTITSSMLDMKELPTFQSKLQILSSTDCIGLQLTDVALWLTKRFYDSGGNVYGSSRSLAEQIISVGSISNFTLRHMQEGVAEMMEVMNALPFDTRDQATGRELTARFEDRRLEKMKKPPDGTYEREIPKWTASFQGGRSASIPERYLCPGRRHDLRLTECYCGRFTEA